MEISHDTGPVQFIGSGADAVNHTLLLELGVQAWETKCLFNSLLLFFVLQFWYIRLVPELVYSIHVAPDCRNVNKRFRRYPLQTVFDLRNNHTIGDVVHHKTLLKFSRITLFFLYSLCHQARLVKCNGETTKNCPSDIWIVRNLCIIWNILI